MRSEVIGEILENRLILIVRGIRGDRLASVLEAACRGGIKLAEITFDAKGDPSDAEVAEEIAAAASRFEGRMTIGAGTVLTPEQARLTRRAGGLFVISPDTDPAVIETSREEGLVSIPGALTPTEAARAARCGADLVKLFPAGRMGPGYLKDLTAPLSHIRFLAVGGINPGNMAEYAAAGACGFGIAGSIVDRKAVMSGDLARIEAAAAAAVSAAKAAFGSRSAC